MRNDLKSMISRRLGAVIVLLLGCAALLPEAKGEAVAPALGEASLAQEGALEGGAERGSDPGARAYRASDVGGAIQLWRAALESSHGLPAAERARLAYNLGVAHFDLGEPLVASAWFTAALRLAPRSDDARHNLDIARAEAGLEPAGSDDLTGSALDFVASFTRAEAGWLAVVGALLFAAAALLEAFRGGAWRMVLGATLLVQLLFLAPLVRHSLEPLGLPVMVVADDALPVRTVPLASGERLGALERGEIVRAVDRVDGWTKVRFQGEDRWVRSSGVLPVEWPLEWPAERAASGPSGERVETN